MGGVLRSIPLLDAAATKTGAQVALFSAVLQTAPPVLRVNSDRQLPFDTESAGRHRLPDHVSNAAAQ
jgi:hypothetical protein